MVDKNTDFYEKVRFNCGGKPLNLSTPKVMGILNVTPDSFFDGGQHQFLDNAIKQAGKMIEAGASIIDVGGMSTRPGSEKVSIDEELKRTIPIIEALNNKFSNTIFSIDTVHAKVAVEAIDAGASIVNDISAGSMDEGLLAVVAKANVPYVLMHMQGTPGNMQLNPGYINVVKEVSGFFKEKITELNKLGISNIILDPGFGFGKSVDDNYSLLKNLRQFNIFSLPIMVGISRKSMINKVLNIKPSEALNGTTALNMVALINGAKVLRVHDVKEAMETIHLYNQIEKVK